MNLPLELRPARFEAFLAHVEQTRLASQSSAAAVVVIQHDHIVAEWYSGHHHNKSGARPVTADSQFNVYSIRKSHIALALALAVLEADIHLDTPATPFLPESGIPAAELEGVTIRHVLTKTKPKFFGPQKVEGEGLAGQIVKHLTGQTIAQVINQRVLVPLELEQTEWIAVPKESLVCDYTVPDGYASVRVESNEGHERNLHATARDLAFWGYLFLNKGAVNGRQIIPSSVFNLSASLQAAPGYAGKRVMGWYHGENRFEAWGATGCHVIALPAEQAVAVTMFNRAHGIDHTDTLLSCLATQLN